jgi:HEPN domain-containing protein
MQPLTLEWIAKAEGDFATALRELRARKNPNYDAACFHAHQCAEKYLKARLQEAGIAAGRTHDLVHLLDLALPVEPAWVPLRSHLRALTTLGGDVRYPGFAATRALARDMVSHAREVRLVIRQGFGLSP